jgi:hypothetical protein
VLRLAHRRKGLLQNTWQMILMNRHTKKRRTLWLQRPQHIESTMYVQLIYSICSLVYYEFREESNTTPCYPNIPKLSPPTKSSSSKRTQNLPRFIDFQCEIRRATSIWMICHHDSLVPFSKFCSGDISFTEVSPGWRWETLLYLYNLCRLCTSHFWSETAFR